MSSTGNPPLELDDKWFEVLATSPTCIVTRHRITGDVTAWSLEWSAKHSAPAKLSNGIWEYFTRKRNEQ